MKSKLVSRVVAVLGILGLSVTMAQAGGMGGGPVALKSFFVCHGINGGSLGAQALFDIYSDELLPLVSQGVRVGSAVVGCTQVRVWPAGTPVDPNTGFPTASAEINPAANGVILNYLKCYTISVPRGQAGSPPGGTPALFDATDVFGTETDLNTTQLLQLCAPADFGQQP